MLVRGPGFAQARIYKKVDSLDEDDFLCSLVVDVHRFSRLDVQIIDVLHWCQASWLYVAQNCKVYFGHCMIV